MKTLRVSAGVLLRDDTFLLTERPKGKTYAGYWEFPGGKIEENETPKDAIARELKEELGITVLDAALWKTKVFTYPHARVTLYFFHVRQWEGEPQSCENQRLCWETLPSKTAQPLLPANHAILATLPKLFEQARK